MKCTGVIRRIDELGRIVIPKEIRKSLAIREGESLEIFTEEDKLILKKYSKFENYQENINDIVNQIATVFHLDINIYDRDKLIVSSNEKFKNLHFENEFNKIILERKETILEDVKIEDESIKLYCKPIIVLSDVVGIIAIKINNNIEEVIKVASFLALIISKKMDIS